MSRSNRISGILLIAFCLLAGLMPALAVTDDPPGNRSRKQPPIDMNSIKRAGETRQSFEEKYQRIMKVLRNDPGLIRSIKSAAARYAIDPVHMIGAIVGEHTYNVGVIDSAQGYYVKALAYLGVKGLAFGYKDQPIAVFIARPEFKDCKDAKDQYDIWSCREDVYNQIFRGKTIDGVIYPDDRFSKLFFQPLFAGQTFGLGQINPLTALMVSDIVHRESGLPELTAEQAPQVYEAIMDPDSSLDYMAAIIRLSIDTYRDIGGVDISGNPGITATLYNLGDVRDRARALAAERRQMKNALPVENYYGWLVNDRLEELKSLL